MKKITSIEIRCLKEILNNYREEIIQLRIENEELRKELEESRAKEGMGIFERLMKGLGDAISGIRWNDLGKSMSEFQERALALKEEENDL